MIYQIQSQFYFCDWIHWVWNFNLWFHQSLPDNFNSLCKYFLTRDIWYWLCQKQTFCLFKQKRKRIHPHLQPFTRQPDSIRVWKSYSLHCYCRWHISFNPELRVLIRLLRIIREPADRHQNSNWSQKLQRNKRFRCQNILPASKKRDCVSP